MGEWISTEEAALKLNTDRSVVTRWCKAGRVKARQVPLGRRTVWQVHHSVTGPDTNKEANLDDLEKEWRALQANGYLTGKAIGLRALDNNEYGLRKYWEYLGKPKEIGNISPECLRLALSNVPIDYKAMKCHYGQRDQMYKAVRSFWRLLVLKNLKHAVPDSEWKALCPKRIFPPVKPVLKTNQFKALLDTRYETKGRCKINIEITQTMLLLMGEGGLRRGELLNLTLANVDMENHEIHVINGKGNKNRIVGMTPAVYEQLQRWLKVRATIKGCTSPKLLVDRTGDVITADAVRHRLKRLGKKIEAHVTPHALRRTTATLMDDNRVPRRFIQKHLGHGHQSTTEGYIMTDEQDAIDHVKRLGASTVKTKAQKLLELVKQ